MRNTFVILRNNHNGEIKSCIFKIIRHNYEIKSCNKLLLWKIKVAITRNNHNVEIKSCILILNHNCENKKVAIRKVSTTRNKSQNCEK